MFVEFVIECFIVIHLWVMLNRITNTETYDIQFILNFILFLFLYSVHTMRLFVSLTMLVIN